MTTRVIHYCRASTRCQPLGGASQVRDVARCLRAHDSNAVRGISPSSDAQLNQFLKLLAQREMLLDEVDKARVQINPVDWRHLRSDHDSGVARLEGVLGVS